MTTEAQKWPDDITYIRHATSAFNALKKLKAESPLYKEFLSEYDKWTDAYTAPSRKLKALALKVKNQFALNTGDHNTELDHEAELQATEMAIGLSMDIASPDVIFCSPYLRTEKTLDAMIKGWPFLDKVKVVKDDRIREHEHGLALLYNDWKVFFVFEPKQRQLHELQGPYWYQYPQGENVPMVRARNYSHYDTMIRDFKGKHVMVVTHHLNILATRANFERWGPEEFMRVDKDEKPINCGVTRYAYRIGAAATPHSLSNFGPPTHSLGKLQLEYYNKKYYE